MWRLRPLAPDEHDWAYALHRAALGDYVAATWGWDDAVQRRMFAQAPERQVIDWDGERVGVLSTEERPRELYLALIELLPEWQGRGIGTAILHDLRARAHASGRELALQVMRANPRALALYEREGLRVVAEDERKLQLRG